MASYHRSSLTASATNISRKWQRLSRASSHLCLDAVTTKQRRKCMAQIARTAWHADGTSALTSANRRVPGLPERETDATLGQSPECGTGVLCKAIHVAVFGARQFHSSRQMYK